MTAYAQTLTPLVVRPTQELGGAATALFYQSEEGSEGRRAYAEKRAPDFSRFKRLP